MAEVLKMIWKGIHFMILMTDLRKENCHRNTEAQNLFSVLLCFCGNK